MDTEKEEPKQTDAKEELPKEQPKVKTDEERFADFEKRLLDDLGKRFASSDEKLKAIESRIASLETPSLVDNKQEMTDADIAKANYSILSKYSKY